MAPPHLEDLEGLEEQFPPAAVAVTAASAAAAAEMGWGRKEEEGLDLCPELLVGEGGTERREVGLVN